MLSVRVKKCSFVNCQNDSKNRTDLSFFKYPKRNLKEWIAASGNAQLCKMSESNMCSNYYVCSNHFRSTDYKRILSPFKTRAPLKHGVVPLPYNQGNLKIEDSQGPDVHETNDQGMDISPPASPAEFDLDQKMPQEKENTSNTEVLPKKRASSATDLFPSKYMKTSSDDDEISTNNSSEVPSKTTSATLVKNLAETSMNSSLRDSNTTLIKSNGQITALSPDLTPSKTHVVPPVKTPVIPPVKTSVTPPVKTPVRPPGKTSVRPAVKTPVKPPVKIAMKAPERPPNNNPTIPILGIINPPLRAPVPAFVLIPSMTSVSAPVTCPASTSVVTPIRTPITTSVTSVIKTPVTTTAATPIRISVTTAVVNSTKTPTTTSAVTPIRISVTTDSVDTVDTPVKTFAASSEEASAVTYGHPSAMTCRDATVPTPFGTLVQHPVDTSCHTPNKTLASFSIRCSVCHTSEIWTCSTCRARECHSQLEDNNDQDYVSDASANVASDEPQVSTSNCSGEFVKFNIKLEPEVIINEAPTKANRSQNCGTRITEPASMSVDEKIRDLETRLKELRKAKVGMAAAAKNDSAFRGLPEDDSGETEESLIPIVSVYSTSGSSVAEIPTVAPYCDQDKYKERKIGLDTNDRLDIVENNITKLKDNIAVIQQSIKAIQTFVTENNSILKKRDKTKPFLPSSTGCRFSPAQTREELNRMVQRPDMVQFLSEIKESTLLRTVTKMMKCLMSKELARKYSLTGSSQRKESSKISFKNSPAYQALEQAVLSSPNYHSVQRTKILRVINYALKNCADWDYCRPKHPKSKQAKRQAPSQTCPAPIPAPTVSGDQLKNTAEEMTSSTKDDAMK